MSDHQRDSASGPGADLEYDLAHEASGAAAASGPGAALDYDLAHEASGAATSVARQQHVAVVTDTPDYDGDYSYDMAHDVPAR